MMALKQIISLGAGVQSSTMALMASCGELTPMPLIAIFADTQAEPESVYKWLDWLKSKLKFPIVEVTAGNLRDDSLRVKTSSKSGKPYSRNKIPAYTDNGGMLFRHCTSDYKIVPIHRYVKASIGDCMMWIGISRDEVHRMKPSRVDWIQHRWPLIDANMTRHDCLKWMESRGFPEPPRSACTFCPFHGDKEWLRLKTDEPKAFSDAVLFEAELQHSYSKVGRIDGVPFLHETRKPLGTVDFDPHKNQQNLFGNECEGMCGV